MTTYTRISSMSDIDFDTLFAASLPAMDAGTYPWPEGVADEAAKKSMFAAHAQNLLDAPAGFCMKGERDGVCVVAIFGVLSSGVYSNAVGLLRSDATGSRAFIHDPEYVSSYYTFLREAGATTLQVVVPKLSAIRAYIDKAYSFSGDDVYSWRDGTYDRVRVAL